MFLAGFVRGTSVAERGAVSRGAIMKKLACLVVAIFVAACGSSSSSNDPGGGDGGSASSSSATDPNPCIAATKKICEHACACGTNGACVIAYGGGTVTESHKSKDDCENFYAFMACGNPQYAKDYDQTCVTALDSATCTTTSQGGALAYPSGCHVSK
jgi:hypothetical protein